MTRRLFSRVLGSLLAVGMTAIPVAAHDMWVNASTGTDPDSGHLAVVTSIGWGHAPLPISEFVSGARLTAYTIIAPDGTMMPLPVDAEANAEVNMIPEGEGLPGLAQMQGGDPFARRMILDDEAPEGTWRVHAENPGRVFSTWIEAGEEVSGSRFADELEAGVEVVSSTVSVRSGDAYWSVSEWTAPQAVDAPLQLLPMSDLAAAQAGDELVFEIWRDGERMAAPEGATLAAFSSGDTIEGTVDAEGALRISLPESGIWVVRSTHYEAVADAGEDYAEFEGRIEDIRFVATVALALGS